jgi:hypothetical protein
MKTYYLFQSHTVPDLRGVTDSPMGEALPAESAPWILEQTITPDEEWTVDTSRAVVAAAILENGFYLWEPVIRSSQFHPVIKSDRVEGTSVFNQNNERIGSIKSLLIEKVSGRVLYVEVTFGGFLSLGEHRHTIPWNTLRYDMELEGYRTDITEEQARSAPPFYGDGGAWPDPKRKQEHRTHWGGDAGESFDGL